MVTQAGEYLIALKYNQHTKIDTSKVKTVVIDKKNMSQFPDGSLIYNDNGEIVEVEILK